MYGLVLNYHHDIFPELFIKKSFYLFSEFVLQNKLRLRLTDVLRNTVARQDFQDNPCPAVVFCQRCGKGGGMLRDLKH